MSKEEILEKAHPDKSYLTPPTVNYQTSYKAMDEYAKQQAIAFQIWVQTEATPEGYSYTPNTDTWDVYGEKPRHTKEYTTEELYQLFLNQQTQK